ncbi:MAG: thiol:disulfide interchange protein DsbA/DsbL [Pseudomonadota bacterium]
MNNLKLAGVMLSAIVLVACGNADEPALQDTPAVSETTVTETTAPEAQEAPEETLAAVEESDGSFDEEAQAREVSLRIAQNTAESTPVRFQEGTHFARFRPTKATVGGGNGIEVVEVFWYGCNHCFNLEPFVRQWKAGAAEDVSFVKMPAVWNPIVEQHAKLFYTIEALANSGELDSAEPVHQAIFDAIHVERRRIQTESAFKSLLAKFNVRGETFDAAWNSFEVDTRMRQAKSLNRSYNIASVPTMVVNGKFVTDETRAGGKQQLFAVIDELVASER